MLIAIDLFAANFSLSAQNMEQRAINRAKAVARQCVVELGYPENLQLVSGTQPYVACDYRTIPNPNNMGYKVTVWGRTQCPPNAVCIQVIYPIATVYVDCNGAIDRVECGVASE